MEQKSSYSNDQLAALSERLLIRQIRVTVAQKGFRVTHFYIATTLLDPIRYPAKAIADLYFKRWDVELSFRHIKTTMGMDILRCKTPDMIIKEILMHMIAYNGIRQLMVESASRTGVAQRRISFKGSLQAIRQWEPLLKHAKLRHVNRQQLLDHLYPLIGGLIVLERPGRRESRALKRRPKNVQLMTMPRYLMQEVPHRGRCYAKPA